MNTSSCDNSFVKNQWLWMFPFKPVRITEQMFRTTNWSNWIMEAKWDGWRVIPTVNGATQLWTRERKPIVMPNNLREQLQALNLPAGTVLDGEIWTPTKRGSWKHDKGVVCNLAFWDVIRVGFQDVSQERLEKRHERLVELIGDKMPNIVAIEQHPATVESFERILKLAKTHHNNTDSKSGFIHGVVLKKLGSPRRDHPTRSTEHADWVKVVFSGMQSGDIR
jgi:ATP-dependent DNA ligase